MKRELDNISHTNRNLANQLIEIKVVEFNQFKYSTNPEKVQLLQKRVRFKADGRDVCAC